MRDANGQHLCFAGFDLDAANELLRNEGVVVKLPPQPFKVLAMLASRPGQLVRREELCRAIWGRRDGGGFRARAEYVHAPDSDRAW